MMVNISYKISYLIPVNVPINKLGAWQSHVAPRNKIKGCFISVDMTLILDNLTDEQGKVLGHRADEYGEVLRLPHRWMVAVWSLRSPHNQVQTSGLLLS